MKTARAGFSLIEVIMAMIVISVSIAALTPLVGLVSRSADPMLVKQAESAAEALMDEVRLAGFTWCDPADANFDTATAAAGCASVPEGVGPEAGNTRPYDNVNDYNVYCSSAMNPITDIAGTSTTLLSGFSATVCVTPYAIDLSTSAPITTAAALRIVVTVSNANTSFTLTGWRTRYAPNS